ncbi:MAG: hemolysin family protein [Clostridiales Family XIII bacterium]|jgi:putative hemolysin|nr:hemolysin family protein [Clostridiales Family XIII bacterium]
MTDTDPASQIALQLLLIFVLIIINAFFAAAEMAMVSVNKTRIVTLREEGDKRAKVLLDLMDKPNKFLSAIQVVITLAGLFQSASAATTIAAALSKRFEAIGMPAAMPISVAVVTVILAYFSLVLGELAPKRIALQFSEKIALFTCRAVHMVSVISAPFIWLLSKSVMVLLRLFGLKDDRIDELYSEEEIRSILDVGEKSGMLGEGGKEMITSVFEFDDKLAYEIMTPRTDIFMLNINEKLEDYVDDMLASKYSRIPFFDKDNDDIIGVLYLKDYIVKAKKQGFNRVAIRKILQKPYFVPETKKIDELFFDMQENKKHIAFLVDEYGGLSGIVTLEDMVEEVMGNIDDEYDDYEPKIDKIDETHYEIDGNFYLDDLNEILDTNLKSDDYETIGGLIIDTLGEIPSDDDKEKRVVEIENLVLTVDSWKERRIERVLLEVLPISKEADDEEYTGKNDDYSTSDTNLSDIGATKV